MDLRERVTRVVPPSRRRIGLPGRIAVTVAAVVLVAVGVWVTGGLLTDDATVAMAATAVWFALAVAVAVSVGLRWRDLALPVVGSVLLTSAALGGFLLWTSEVDRVVDEDVLTAPPSAGPASPASPESSRPAGSAPPPAAPADPVLLGAGAFRSGEHETTGTASLLRRPDGSAVVTLTDLDTDPGPDLRVYLTVGPGGDVRGALDLGALRGNRGTQQYEVPAAADVRRYGAVVIWCRAFSVAFGTAAFSG